MTSTNAARSRSPARTRHSFADAVGAKLKKVDGSASVTACTGSANGEVSVRLRRKFNDDNASFLRRTRETFPHARINTQVSNLDGQDETVVLLPCHDALYLSVRRSIARERRFSYPLLFSWLLLVLALLRAFSSNPPACEV